VQVAGYAAALRLADLKERFLELLAIGDVGRDPNHPYRVASRIVDQRICYVSGERGAILAPNHKLALPILAGSKSLHDLLSDLNLCRTDGKLRDVAI
jgi:hypothetical protein